MNASPDWNRSSRRDAWDRIVAAGPPAWVLAHVQAVEGLAVAMALQAQTQGHVVDVERVSLGALLHDIGRSKVQDLHHAHVGADLLREPPAWPEPICRIVETHIGAGVLPEEAHTAGLPPRDYVPSTLEEKLVAHADNLFTGERRMSLDDVQKKYATRGLADAALRIEALHRELCGVLGCEVEIIDTTNIQ